MSMIDGRVVWSELSTDDPGAAREFCERTFGWRCDPVEAEGSAYLVAYCHARPVAGLRAVRPDDVAAGTWQAYVAVADLDATVAAIAADGGEILRNPWYLEDVGRLALVAAASGARFGLITPESAWDPPMTDNGSLDNVPV